MERPMEGWAGKALDPIAGIEGSKPDNSPSVEVLSLPGFSFWLHLTIHTIYQMNRTWFWKK